MSSSSSIKVKFLIDREEKRVVFVEAGSDFVDVLFSFLTLPLGAIVRLLKKQSGLGSLDSLYESIEQLDAEYLRTEACKEMLLNPRSAADRLCEDLKIKGIHGLNPRRFYTCSQDGCLIHSICYYTYSSKVLCSRCGKLMDKTGEWEKETSEEEGGVFVKATTEFMITDDLRVEPASLLKSISLLKEMHIKDTCMLEERVMEFGTKEALNLLGRSLVSKNALTEVCFPDACMQGSASSYLSIEEEIAADEAQNEIKVVLILNKKNNCVLYAETGDDFINQLISFLAFPLGSVLKFLSDMSPFGGCIQNLYSSVENMGLEYFKSEICRNMLLTPKLDTFYGYKNRLILELEEITTVWWTLEGSCAKCYADNEYKSCPSTQCVHGVREMEFVEQNPKSVKSLLDNSVGFVVGCRRFGIMDNLHISLLSAVSAIANGENLSISDLVGKELSLDKCKLRSLLHAMVISKTVLTDVFAPRRKQPRGNSTKHA